MATCTDYIRGLIIKINDDTKGMPTILKVKNDQHPYLAGMVNGFWKTILGVPVFIDSGCSTNTPKHRKNGQGSDSTISYTKDSTSPKLY